MATFLYQSSNYWDIFYVNIFKFLQISPKLINFKAYFIIVRILRDIFATTLISRGIFLQDTATITGFAHFDVKIYYPCS